MSTLTGTDGVAASWPWWTDAARTADEPRLALALDDRAPAGPGDPVVPAVLRARDLLLTGRAADADASLARAGVLPSVDGAAAYPQLVLAAVRAARGDHAAWAWLTGTGVTHWPVETVAPLVGAAADARGDQAAADDAWIAAGSVRSDGESLVRRAAATLASRRGLRADVLGKLVGRCADHLVEVAPDHDASVAMAVAESLERRGDSAGARLLLHAVSARTADGAPVEAALRRLTPSFARYRLAGVAVAVVFACVALLAATHGADGAVRPFLALPALAFVTLVRIPGLTSEESKVWRRLRERVYDAPTGGPASRQGRRSGWYGVAAIVGAALGIAADVVLVAPLGRTLAGDDSWDGSDAAFFVMLVVIALAAVGAALAARAALHARLRRRNARRASADAAALARAGGSCRCTSVRWLDGPLADAYAVHHLVPVTGVAGPVPGATLGRCPATGALWLAGRLGAHGRWLALSGRPLPAPATPVARYPA